MKAPVEQYERQLLEALRAFLRSEPARVLLTEQADWARLWELAAQQKVLPMAADALAPALRTGGGEANLAAVRKTAVQTMTVQFHRSAVFLELYRKLLEKGTRPLVVKGILCRELYPKPDLRISADEDLLVAEEELPTVLAALRKAGMTVEDPDAEQVLACRDSRTGLYLELHRTLFPASSEVYGGLNRFFDDAFANAAEVPVEGGTVWSLCPEAHLLYLILHSFKHFLHSGFGIRQVCDICLFTRAYGAELDWRRLADRLAQARADVFAANLLAIGREYLGFSRYPEEAEAWMAGFGDKLDCGDLLADLLASGIYGSSSLSRQHSSLITLNAVKDGAGGRGAHRVLRTMFPARKDLLRAYPYLERYPWLLPAAWVQRLGRYQSQNGGAESARESLSIGAQRVELLKKYQVIR